MSFASRDFTDCTDSTLDRLVVGNVIVNVNRDVKPTMCTHDATPPDTCHVTLNISLWHCAAVFVALRASWYACGLKYLPVMTNGRRDTTCHRFVALGRQVDAVGFVVAARIFEQPVAGGFDSRTGAALVPVQLPDGFRREVDWWRQPIRGRNVLNKRRQYRRRQCTIQTSGALE